MGGMSGQKYPSCSCPHHSMTAVFILLFGLLFLLEAFGVFDMVFVSYAWPILVILYGLNRLFRRKCNCCGRDK